jgi:hypothetical protein
MLIASLSFAPVGGLETDSGSHHRQHRAAPVEEVPAAPTVVEEVAQQPSRNHLPTVVEEVRADGG